MSEGPLFFSLPSRFVQDAAPPTPLERTRSSTGSLLERTSGSVSGPTATSTKLATASIYVQKTAVCPFRHQRRHGAPGRPASGNEIETSTLLKT